MCRNSITLFSFDPPAIELDDIRAGSLLIVRRIGGFNKPSKAKATAFTPAINAIAVVSRQPLDSLETNTPPNTRAEEAAKARARAARRT